MAGNYIFSNHFMTTALSALVCSSLLFINSAVSQTWTASLTDELANMLRNDTDALQEAADDYGHIVHEFPLAVLNPSSVYDIASLVNFSNSLPDPIPIAVRGQGHSVHGQSMARNGIVVNMTELGNHRNGSGIVISTDSTNPLGKYADVGGEQKWIDVLAATLEKGLTPVAWTDYLYLSVGGTLSNAGVSGQALIHGPQISNVYELDVLTGTGELVTCSENENPELFFATLGGLGQFGIILRARIPLRPAPKRVKWTRLLYKDFSLFTRDQERLLGRNKANAADYVEGEVVLNQTPLDLSFYPEADQQRVASLVSQNGIIYIIEVARYLYEDDVINVLDHDSLLEGTRFVPGFTFQKDVVYEEFLNRVRSDEEMLTSIGIWSRPHPWLNLLIPKSAMVDFDSGVFRGILIKNQNLTPGLILTYALDRTKWDARMSAVTPDEDTFYIVGILPTSGFENWEAFDAQNKEILEFCEKAGMNVKQYLPMYSTEEEWAKHFGPKWKTFQERKSRFDPKHILSPGQRIFNV